MDKKKGQLTIFIIVGIVIVAAIVLIFALKGTQRVGDIPANVEPVYTSFLSCLENDALNGVDILESQGGYIDLPVFEPGSQYMPFSSQLNFVGTSIPYWYYVSGNNMQKEQVPTKEEMQRQLASFVEKRIQTCNFEQFYENQFRIEKGDPKASVIIRDSEVEVDLNMKMFISKGEDTALINDHKVILKSRLGKLYDSALKAYQKEQKELFLENYSIDILRLYAPVDGVEFSCSPLSWNAENIFNRLGEAIEANTLALKSKGNGNDYFVVDFPFSENVRFINSRNWSSSFEVLPSEGPVLIATPVGNQPGLGILGFCYVPYHFVYNVKYPVLIQVYEGNEIFQFPVAIVIRGNRPREPLSSSAVELGIPDFCKYKNTLIEVNTYNVNKRVVDADISYECSGTSCYIGKTSGGRLSQNFPQCVNGKIIARAEGYAEANSIFTSVSPESIDLYLDKLYGLEVRLRLDGKNYDKDAIINFVSNESSKSVVYPQQKRVELSEGQYEVQVYTFENSTLKLGSSVQQQCVDVPNGIFGNLFGFTKKQCFDVVVPEQIISNALSGGGKQNYYISTTQLEGSRAIEINAGSLPKPTTLEQLQQNYILFEDKNLDINFR